MHCLSISTGVHAGCVALLEADGHALAGSRALLLETLFTLAQDEWPQVERPVRAWLSRKRAAAAVGRHGGDQGAIPGSERCIRKMLTSKVREYTCRGAAV